MHCTMKYKSDISVVVGIGPTNNLELVKNFIGRFTVDHPTVPLILGALQCNSKIKKFLEDADRILPNVHVVFGDPVDGHYVSFSENYNAAINAVATEKFVLGHTDMVFCKNFFEILERDMKPGNFYIYNTVEPPIYIGHRRPGKTIGDFGENFESFNQDGFEKYVFEIQSRPQVLYRGYGFFLAGYTTDMETVGGFDMETFTPVFCEDDDICIRIRQKGYHMLVDEHAMVYHFVSLTAREAKKNMTAPEIEANRKFARKWGFEARFLWTTGYEQSEKPLRIWEQKIYCDVQDSNTHVLTGDTKKEEANIIIEIPDKIPFVRLSNIVGSLRLTDPQNLKEGTTYKCSGCKVSIIHSNFNLVEDKNNYLSLQKQIKYE